MENQKYENLVDFYSSMNRNIIVYYKGPFDEIILSEIGTKIRKKIFDPPKIGHRLFSVFMELAQNISLYSAEKNQLESGLKWGVGTIAVYETKESYILISGNLVKNDVLKQIVEKCEEINNLDHEGLRAMKREYRSSEIKANHKGGNIGLIQVALKSDLPLELDIKEVDKEHSFFTISVNVLKQQTL
ncbi:SiaB family protein kinase [Fulvivirga sp. 29W222]|uniref:SiaB family protein kinase n=1 Tax=Fulvivirga marina TaxID=2494733 RepID=A0A937KC57_9BACT|nr:SiaB family protein kinase [Fulvivirga marina]MBL6447152.1 SiaB family protein kinase [Fulvivirga marina]